MKINNILEIFNVVNFGILVLLTILILSIYIIRLNKKAAYLKSRNGDLPKEFIEESFWVDFILFSGTPYNLRNLYVRNGIPSFLPSDLKNINLNICLTK